MIPLIKDTLENSDIDHLIEWLKSYPRLTKGEQTLEFEKQWASYIGCSHAVFVNSGSSANLAMLYAAKLKLETQHKEIKVVVPALSWATDLAPVIQLGMTPILCDASKENLGLDLKQLEEICIKERPQIIIVVHVLGIPANIKEIRYICKKYDIILLEDSCETVGTEINKKRTGSFGDMSSFSFYFGHHISCIEGGMICTDNYELYNLLNMIRSHGWDRDLSKDIQQTLRQSAKVDDFQALYTFYVPGFNIRSTDLQAFIGINQIPKLESVCMRRFNNFKYYQENIYNTFWKVPRILEHEILSNFAYPIIHPKRNEIAKALKNADIETRPLICGSLSLQPFFKTRYTNNYSIKWAEYIHSYGLYIPNNQKLKVEELELICKTINTITRN